MPPTCGDGMCELGEDCDTCPDDCAPPTGATNLSPDGETIVALSVPLDWDPLCAATSYDVLMYYWRDSDMEWRWYHEWIGIETDSFTVWPVLSTDFYFQVRATNAAGTGPYSDPVYFTATVD